MDLSDNTTDQYVLDITSLYNRYGLVDRSTQK